MKNYARGEHGKFGFAEFGQSVARCLLLYAVAVLSFLFTLIDIIHQF